MTRLHEQIITPLPIDDTFAFVADFANSMLWDPGVASSERIDSGPLGVGARYQLGVRMSGRVAPMEYRISVFEAPRRVVLLGEGSGVSAVDDIRFEPNGTGTRIDYTADIRLGGLLRLAQPFLGGTFRKIASDALEGMQRALDERAAAASAPPATLTRWPDAGGRLNGSCHRFVARRFPDGPTSNRRSGPNEGHGSNAGGRHRVWREWPDGGVRTEQGTSRHAL